MTSLPVDLSNLRRLRDSHPAWRLLTASHAPLVVSFLHQAFLATNTRTASLQDLVSRLDDHLNAARDQGDELPRGAEAYLDEWAGDGTGWLRKFYPPDSDEAHYDLTPAAEKAITWIARLLERRFVGTESRLMTVFQLLTEMVEGSESDPDTRRADLERRRAMIDQEIARLDRGEVIIMDAAALKDRFQQMASTARELLADFRELEQSFHQLDRDVRQRIAGWTGGRGELLDDVLGQRDTIASSDQGASFRAFWDFLMSEDRQEEFTTKLRRVLQFPAVRELAPDPRIARIHYDWLAAGEITQRTVARLSEQLRRYLDDKVWLENRRIVELIRRIEQHAIELRNDAPRDIGASVDDFAPAVELPLERPLFTLPFEPHIVAKPIESGDDDIDAHALFDQVAIDRTRLRDNIRSVMRSRDHVTLGEVIGEYPLRYGLGELVTYLAIASDDENAVIDDHGSEAIDWIDARGLARRVAMPIITYFR